MTDDDRTWFKPSQVEELRNACYSSEFASYLQSRNDAIIALMYDTGLRPCEVTGLTTEMFHPDEPALKLPSGVQKQYPTDTNPPPANIELSKDDFTSDTVRTVQQYLNNRWKDSLFVFPSRNKESMTTRSLRNTIKDVAVQAGVSPYVGFSGRGEPEDVSPYTLRHSVAYRLLNAREESEPMIQVTQRLRHRSQQTTERHYNHFDSV